MSKRWIFCPRCLWNVEMEKVEEKRPYITRKGVIFQNVSVDVYKCPKCGSEKEVLPENDDGYSAGAGLMSED